MVNVGNSQKVPLVGMHLEELQQLAQAFRQEPYRGQQLFQWVYHHKVDRFEEMRNLSRDFRLSLEQEYTIHALRIVKEAEGTGGAAQKFLLETLAGDYLEAVLIREGRRRTVCVSTQVGCALGCQFCATARMGFVRNLTAGEIVDQVLLLQGQIEERVTNVVFMGMGEPFLNYQHVMDAALLLTHPQGMNLGSRRITISTVGIVPKIRQFTTERRPFKLAISLNGVSQKQRSQIMPITRKYSLNDILHAAREYYHTIRRYLTFEYVLLKGINDTPHDARTLIRLIGDLPCKVNVIPYNEMEGPFQRPGKEAIQLFLDTLYQAPFTVTVRWSKGTEINAGCGQLAVHQEAMV